MTGEGRNVARTYLTPFDVKLFQNKLAMCEKELHNITVKLLKGDLPEDKQKRLNRAFDSRSNNRLFILEQLALPIVGYEEDILRAVMRGFLEFCSVSKNYKTAGAITKNFPSYQAYDCAHCESYHKVKINILPEPFEISYVKLNEILQNLHINHEIASEEYESLARKEQLTRVSVIKIIHDRIRYETVVTPKPLPVMPPVPHEDRDLIEEYYVCGRKTLYVFENLAQLQAAQERLSVYACRYCSGFHMGHPPRTNITGYKASMKKVWEHHPERLEAFLKIKSV